MALVRLAWVLLVGTVSSSVLANAWVQTSGEPFAAYRERMAMHFMENKLWVSAEAKQQELEAVLPFEYRPNDTCSSHSVGVLMFHGLSDSPFSLRDPAQALADQCIHVRVMVLPGHGTRAEDLLEVSRQDWRAAVKSAVANFSSEVDMVYLAGFSTGGALVTEYAWQQPEEVQGVVLFSPLFKINSTIDWLSPWLAPMIDWLDHYDSDDYSKYASIPVPAIAEAYSLAKEVKATVLAEPGKVPVFVALSEEDATVDSAVTIDVFEHSFVAHVQSEMILYSASRPTNDAPPVHVVNTDLPEQRIFGLSHMSVHGAPHNPYYGEQGAYRICSWYQSDPDRYQECREAEQNWYGERSKVLQAKSDVAARLSWNPYFQDLMKHINSFIHKTQQSTVVSN